MPIKLLIMEYPVNPNSSVPQVVLQPYQQRSESTLSLDRQGGKHPVSEKNCGFSFCYPPICSVTLQFALKKVSEVEDSPKRAVSAGRKNLGLGSCSFCHPLFLDFAVQEGILQLS